MDFIEKSVPSVEEAIKSKAMSKIGDAIANLIFSIAQSRYSKETRGTLDFSGTPKVSAKILKDAATLLKEKTGVKLPVKGDAHAIADAVEAVIAFGWSKKKLFIEHGVDILTLELLERNPTKLRDEHEAYVEGFFKMLKLVYS
ncbi:MAG: ribonuclease III family protein [Promethearchaeota archaeon]